MAIYLSTEGLIVRTKRVALLSVAIAAIVLGVVVAVLVWPFGGSVSTQDADITAISADGRIEWVQVRFVPAETNNTIAEEMPDSHHVGRLSDKTTFFVALGENGIVLDDSGVGASPVSRDRFLAKWSEGLYAVRLTIKDGVVTKIAEYYHP